MVAGYKASHLRLPSKASSNHRGKIGQAEADLHDTIFYRDKPIDKH